MPAFSPRKALVHRSSSSRQFYGKKLALSRRGWVLLIAAVLGLLLLSACATAGQPAINENEQILQIEEIVIALLAIAVTVGIIAGRLRLPYTIGLVLMGLALAARGELNFNLPPNLILAFLVPPLIFEAAFHINYGELRKNMGPILALAVPGVILTTLLVGGVVSWGTGLPIALALVLGALVSATDPVSIVALFRSIGVPKRLQLLLEGESLFNDGTAIVIFNVVLAIALENQFQINWINSTVEFFWVVGGGLLVGVLLGSLVSQLITHIDDYLIETALTSVLAFGAYLLGELIGVSGVLAVVAAGLINGNIGSRGMSPTTRIVVFNFWEFAAFLANSFVFLLLGLQINVNVLIQNWYVILWAVGAVLLVRAIIVYGMSWFSRDIPFKWQHILYWGGIRGAISLALALSLPLALGDARGQIQVMAFGVVLFSLLVQGLTMNPLINRLQVVEISETQLEYQRRQARALASREAYDHLSQMYRQGLLSSLTWQRLSPVLKEHMRVLAESVRDVITADPSVETEELSTIRREYLSAQRSKLSSMAREGLISDQIFDQLVTEVDAALAESDVYWPEVVTEQNNHREINRLMTVVVQEQDVENALSSLTKLGVAVTRLPSTGGFLGRRNATFLIGLNTGREEAVVRALTKSCRRRVEYIATPLEGSPLPFPSPSPITVGGATIFTIEVERYEEF